MSNISCLSKLSIPVDILKDYYLAPIGAYLQLVRDMKMLLKLMGAGTSLFDEGNVKAAISNFKEIYESIPESQIKVKENARILLEQAQLCL